LYIDNNCQYQVGEMQNRSIKVCTGPNCKAWSSDRIARELQEIGSSLGLRCIKVSHVPCMDACHGGVSVRVNSKKKVIKLKEVEDLLIVLCIHDVVLFYKYHKNLFLSL
jgi:NADH:ubiquinone oxidoreductase subunit E